MKKNEKKSTEKDQVLPGDGALRQAIKSVRRAVDVNGNATNKHAIQIGSKWHFLDALELVNGKIDSLAKASQASNLPIDLTKREYVELGAQIAKAVRGSAVVLSSSGYHVVRWKGESYKAVVWRGEAHWIGEEPDAVVVIEDAVNLEIVEPVGDLEEWKAEIGTHFAKNPYMIVTLGAALSALLIRPLALERLMLLLVGESSIGKTAIQEAVQSIIRPGPVDSASGTVLGLQQQMSLQPDQPVFFQETRQVSDASNLINLVFDHGNAGKRVVGHASQQAIEGKALHCVLIASNERTIAEMVRSRNVTIDAGIGARVLELIVDGPHGAFHDVPESMEPAAFAEYLSASSESLYGALWGAWVEVLVTNHDELREKAKTQIPKIRAWLEKKVETKDRILKRMLNGYAGWLFAILSARRHELIDLTADEIKEAFATVITAHKERARGGLSSMDQEILEEIRASIDENPSRFPPLSQVDRKKDGLWGYEHAVADEDLYLVFKSSLGKIAKNHAERDVLRVLKASGMLKHNKDGLMYSVRTPESDMPKRFYAIRKSIRYDG